MYASLKKNGLSDTLHELKSQFLNSSAPKSSKKQPLKNDPKPQATSIISKFQLQQSPAKQRLILDILIDLIQFKQSESCSIEQHDYNPTKYICLQETCSKKIGCSYCFLDKHKLHQKVDAKVCLNDLTELKHKVYNNRQKIRQQLQQKRKEVKNCLQQHIDRIKDQFLSCLEYLNSQIKDAIDKQFSKKLSQLSPYSNSNKNNHKSYISNDISFKQQKLQKEIKIAKQLQISDIIQIFKSGPSNHKRISDLNSLSQKKQSQEPKRYCNQTFPAFNITKDQEFNLLTKLSRLNLTYVEQYLRQQLLQAKQFADYLKVFEGFYNELGASLNELFAAFKRATPSCKSFQTNMTEPQVLAFFSF